MRTLRAATPRKTRAVKLLRVLFWFALIVYACVFLSLTLMQRSFMYHPSRGEERDFLALAARQKVQPWRDAKGALIGWKRETAKPAKNRMLILHGNGGHALMGTALRDGFGAQDKGRLWDFYSLEYPGYGSRPGNATQAEIVAAADAGVKELLKNDPRSLYIAGESLGSGVACLLAAQHPKDVRGLFLITPYTSTADVAASLFPVFPVRLILQDKYEASAALKKYAGPVAVLLAGKDDVVPTRLGQALFDGYSGPKKLWIQENAGHNTLNYDVRAPWWGEVSNFLLRN